MPKAINFDKKRRKEPATPLKLGTDYLAAFSELMEMRDTDEILKKAGKKRHDLQTLLYDDEVYAAVQTRVAALNSCVYSFKSDPPAEVQDLMVDWYDKIVEGIHRSILFGYSVIQIVFDPNNARIIDVVIEDISNFKYLEDGRLIATVRSKEIDVLTAYPTKSQPSKFFLFVHKPDSKNYMGEALLSRAYWPWYFRTNVWKFWVRWLEKFAFPWRVGKTGGSTEAMAAALMQASQDAVLAVDREDDVSIIAPAATSDPFDRINVSLEKRIQKLILGQTLTTDASKASYAAAKIHELVRQDRLLYDIGYTQPRLQSVIDWFCGAYGLDRVEIMIEPLRSISKDRAERDAMLYQYGVLPVTLTREYFLKNYDFTEEDLPSEEYFRPQRTKNGGNPKATPTNEKMSARGAQGGDKWQEKVDGVSADMAKEILSIVASADTAEEISAEVSAKFNADKLSEAMASAMTLAYALGKISD